MILRPTQQKSIELDTKKQILSAVTSIDEGIDVLDYYKKTVKSIVVNMNGEVVEKNEKGEQIIAEKVDIAQNYKKKDPKDKLFPVFIFHSEGNENDVKAYIFPVYGAGLWGPIWGFVALETDLNTLKGIALDHESETPGLGARITTDEVKNRFKGKSIFDDNGQLVSVELLKGENNPQESLDKHHIDGMSGATLTGKGVNQMLKNYLGYYQPYVDKLKKKKESVAMLNE